MKTIYKYSIPEGGGFSWPLPVGSKVLCVQVQFEKPNIWVEVDTGGKTENRHFYVHGTGEKMPDEPARYIGTFQLLGGKYVGHPYELLK